MCRLRLWALQLAERGPHLDGVHTVFGQVTSGLDVVDRIVAHQGEVASLPELVAPGSVDVVLCHGVLEIVEYAWAGFGAAFGPVIVFSLFWPRLTAAGAAAGMLVGAGTVVVWSLVDPFGRGLYELLPGFIAGALAIMVFNPLGTAPEREWVGATGERQPVRG